MIFLAGGLLGSGFEHIGRRMLVNRGFERSTAIVASNFLQSASNCSNNAINLPINNGMESHGKLVGADCRKWVGMGWCLFWLLGRCGLKWVGMGWVGNGLVWAFHWKLVGVDCRKLVGVCSEFWNTISSLFLFLLFGFTRSNNNYSRFQMVENRVLTCGETRQP